MYSIRCEGDVLHKMFVVISNGSNERTWEKMEQVVWRGHPIKFIVFNFVLALSSCKHDYLSIYLFNYHHVLFFSFV